MGSGSLTLHKLFEQGQMESRVPLTTRSGTQDAGELWVGMRCEGGAAGYGETGEKVRGAAQGLGLLVVVVRGSLSLQLPGSRAPLPAPVALQAGYEEGAGAARGYEEREGRITDTGRAEVRGQEYFTKVEDRPVVKERVTTIKEHHPVEKEVSTGLQRCWRSCAQPARADFRSMRTHD
jgi:hypothetical protein